jgi:hypothetical protein
MPPKAKAPTAAATAIAAKKTAAAAAKMTGETNVDNLPPTAAKKTPPKPYHLDVHDGYAVGYYNEGGVDFAEVAMHVNGVLPKGTCRMRLAKDGMSVTWQRSLMQVCFTKEHLCAIMCNYSSSHHRVIAYYNVAQQMDWEERTPDAAGLFWGKAQAIPLAFKATGTPRVTLIRYPMGESVERKGKNYMQFNSIYYCGVQLAEQHPVTWRRSTARQSISSTSPAARVAATTPAAPLLAAAAGSIGG